MTYFKRPIIPLLCAYGLGLGIGRYAPFLPLFAGVAAVVGLWSLYRRDASPTILGFLLLIGSTTSRNLVHEYAEASKIIRSLAPPVSATVQGTVSSVEVSDDIRNRFVLRDVVIQSEVGSNVFPGGVLVTLTAHGEELTTKPPAVGQRVEVSGSFDEPQGFKNFFVLDYKERLARQRIYATLRSSLWTAVSRTGIRGTMWESLTKVRRYALETMAGTMPSDESRWVGSLLFNDRRLLLPHEIRLLRDSNMFHLFAVSGLHVGALSAFVLLGARALRLSWRLSWAITVALAWAYVGMTGFVPSALRAGTMLTAYGASTWFRREIDPVSALALACFLLLVIQPTLLYQTGFILSALGVLGIVAFYPLMKELFPANQATSLHHWVRPVAYLLADVVQVTIAVSLLVVPLQLYYFHQVNILSPIGNVLGALLASPVVMGSLLTIIASLVSFPLANILGAATAALAQGLMAVVEIIGEQNWAILRIPQFPLVAVFGYYGILFSGYYFVRRDSPEFVPKARVRLALHCLAALLVFLVAAAWHKADRRLKIWFLDVGQGDSALVQLPTGQSILVDAGNSLPDVARMVVIPHLQALGCYPLDYVVVTHLDSDHSGGVPALLEEWRIGKLVVGTNITALDRLLTDSCSPKSFPGLVRVCAGYRTLISRALELEVLNPDCSTTGGLASENDNSLVFSVKYKNFSVLLTGDAEKGAESAMLRLGISRCDVLKVAHHGSASSTSDDFLKVASPQIAVISCGRKNRYGHPSPLVLERLNKHGVTVYRTDRHGAVLIQTNGQQIEARTARGEFAPCHFSLE